MEDGQEFLVEVDVKVKPLNGHWRKTNGQEVALKQSQTVKYYKELPTSKPSSGIYKNKSPATETWKKKEVREEPKEVTSKTTSSIYKNKDYSLSSTTASSRKTFSGIRRSRRVICKKKPLPETKKVKMKPEDKSEEVKESYELEGWMILSLLWFFLFIRHYVFVMEEEVKNF